MKTNIIKEEITNFIKYCKSIHIASINLKNESVCSYAPIIHINDEFFIYISEIAEHYEGIKYNSNNIEIMFIEDEKHSSNIYARKRVKFKTNAQEIHREDEKFNIIFENFIKQNPQDETIKIIKNMQDFHLFQLIFKKGRFVKGFGKTYDINEDNINLAKSKEHKNPR